VRKEPISHVLQNQLEMYEFHMHLGKSRQNSCAMIDSEGVQSHQKSSIEN